ncbi:MAG: GGDEF domain-containing protein [Patulibacter sp.]
MSALPLQPAPLPAAAPPIRQSREITRAAIAEDRTVWLATCAIVWAFFVVHLGVLLLVAAPLSQIVLVGVTFAYATVISRSEPPPAESIANHLLLAMISCGVALALIGPGGPGGLIGAMFIGPLYSMRTVSRLALTLHLGASSLLLWTLGGLSVTKLVPMTDQPMALGILLLGVAQPVIGFACMITFQAAESQGAELQRLVRRDPLTGVGNRRLLLETLDDELGRHHRQNKPFSIVTLDLNRFKELNDEHGHAAGDDVLRAVAGVLVAVTAQRDLVARQGGDEFCVILPETGADAIAPIVNAIRVGLHGIETANGPISAGTGWATYPDDAQSVGELLDVADARMRANKPWSRSVRIAKQRQLAGE